MNAPILVFSHLRWNFVFQRPQHLLTRLAAERPVYFIEEPLAGDSPKWEVTRHDSQVTVCCPRLPRVEGEAYSAEQLSALEPMLAQFLDAEGLKEYVLWYYTPMALPLGQKLHPRAIVYDCMDELSQFYGAPRELVTREAELLRQADVVFTGGPSLYRAKRSLNPHVHCFPSSVDARHFAQAAVPMEEPADQQALPHPRLGFFGVLDERLDLELLAALADAHPDWQIVMVGPVVKIDPATLPQRKNIHYLGQRTYEQLPAYLSGWDLCLLPFARNASTEFISPTKTLEYMAAEKLIVSTPITDVAEPYGEIVYLGATPAEFIAACEQALAAAPTEAARRLRGMRAVLEKTSWEQTVQSMRQELDAAVARRQSATLALRHASHRTPAAPHLSKASSSDETPPVVVIGAGPTGLSAAYHLGSQGRLLEKNAQVGGLCRSIHDRGFTYDLAGHIMFSNDPYVHQMYEMLLGDNVHWQDREAWIFSKGVYTRYPFQGCLYGLPAEVITECLVGAIEARFGALKPAAPLNDAVGRAACQGRESQGAAQQKAPTNGRSSPPAPFAASNGNGQAAKGASEDKRLEDCCGDGVLEAETPLALREACASASPPPPRNFEEFIYQVWGRGIAEHFAIPYNRKLWGVPLSEMETSWLGGRVPMPDLEEMIRYALSPAAKPMGPNARFGYPLRGGFQALMDGFLPHLGDRLWRNAAVVRVSSRERTVTLADGREIPFDVLISTMPLPLLLRCMGAEVPPAIRAAAEGLRYVSVRCVHLGVGREQLSEKHWIYYPEETVFHRIFLQGNASPHVNPPGGFGLTCEITYSPDKPLPCTGQDLIDLCIRDCHRVGMFSPRDEVRSAVQADLPFAYVVYDHGRLERVERIRRWLADRNILLAGRYSEWEYYNSDHAFLAGRKAAETALALLSQHGEPRKAAVR